MQAQQPQTDLGQTADSHQGQELDGVVVISDESGPEQVTKTFKKEQKTEKQNQIGQKQRGDSGKESPLVSALQLAFNQKRALFVICRIDNLYANAYDRAASLIPVEAPIQQRQERWSERMHFATAFTPP